MLPTKKGFIVLFSLFVAIMLCGQTYGQTVRGVVTDASTGEPMTGATVLLKEKGIIEYVNLEGGFSFKTITPGVYTLKITYTNYKPQEEKVTVVKETPTIVTVQLEPVATQLSNIVIKAGEGSERNTRNIEKNANQVVNIVSARSMELLPDITVANVMQRVSGVTIEKNNAGEARYPIIRGMEKRYINTLVNGIKIPSPDNKNRFIPLDLFPSEILERLEVSKSLTPSMEGDAIGGTINLVMKDAPSTKLFQANFSGGYNAIFGDQSFMRFDHSAMSKQSPVEQKGSNYVAKPSDFPVGSLNYKNINTPVNTTFGLSVGNRFGKYKKLGVLFSGSYQNVYNGAQSTLFIPDAQPNLNNLPSFVTLTERKYSTQNKRLGLNVKVDYKINSRSKISLLNTFVRLDQLQTRLGYDTVALNSLVTESFRSTWQYQSIYNSTLQGVHELVKSLTFDWSASYSIANNHIPDQAQFGHQYPVTQTNVYSDNLQTMSRNWMHNSDKDFSAYANFTEQTKLFKQPLEIKAGGLIRNKNRDNFYNAYSLNPLLPANTSFQTYTSINAAVFTFTGSNATPGLNGNNYTFHEVVSAGYIQGKWAISNKAEILGGVRIEHTHQNYACDVDSSVNARTGTIYYTDVLPSAQLKYKISNKQQLRASYYRALARPQFAELIPFGPDNYDLFRELGNPFTLKHSLADNFDLRYELLPKTNDQILVGVFYKQIQDPIEFTAVRVPPSSQVLEPNNVGKAVNYGVEAVFTKYVGMFGITVNYTYTQSRVTNDSMLFYYRNAQGVISTKYVSETRPLQGQANNIGSVSAMYKNPKLGLDAQVSFVYTGERVVLVNPYAGLHYWQQPQSTLDFSFEKRFAKKFAFYGKFNNLTNAPQVQSIHVAYDTYIAGSGAKSLSEQTDPSNKIIVQKIYTKPSFLFGIRYKF